jgi:hypothetical protein
LNADLMLSGVVAQETLNLINIAANIQLGGKFCPGLGVPAC